MEEIRDSIITNYIRDSLSTTSTTSTSSTTTTIEQILAL